MNELMYALSDLSGVEVRDPQATGDGCWTMTGYAAVFDQATTLFDSKFVQVTEEIATGAFDTMLDSQDLSGPAGAVHFNHGHDMNSAVAATNVPTGEPGSLELRADEHGLRFFARAPRDDPDAVRMASKMRTGVLGQASFAFTVAEDEHLYHESDDGPDLAHRRILRIGRLYDVCACSQGAYSTTTAVLRSYALARGLTLPDPPRGALGAPMAALGVSGGVGSGGTWGASTIGGIPARLTPEGGASIVGAEESAGDGSEEMSEQNRELIINRIKMEGRKLGNVR